MHLAALGTSVDASIQKLIEAFPSEPFQVSRAMRRYLEEDPSGFRDLAMRALKTSASTPGGRYLATLLSLKTGGIPFHELADPRSMDLDVAIQVAKAIQQNDASFDQRFLEYLADTPLPTSYQTRILEILDAVCPGAKLLTAFRQFCQTADAKLTSKFAMIVARKDPTREWFEARLAEPDPRVRANVIEALWGRRDEKAIGILMSATSDGNCRVRINAAVGLYLAGDTRSLSVLNQAIRDSDPAFRLSGTWALGKIRDPRFEGFLHMAANDPYPQIRTTAQESLKKTQARMADRTTPIEVKISMVSRDPQGRFFLPFTLQTEAHDPVGGIRPLEIMPFQDGEPILNYEVIESQPPAPPGTYFLNAEPCHPVAATERMVKITVGVSCSSGSGEHSSYWFRT